jgi:hypothetical protein
MSEQFPIESEVIAELLRNPIIIKIVTILDGESLPILDVLEYGLSTTDVNLALANQIIKVERSNPSANKESSPINMPEIGGDYYYEFLNKKVMLTEIGLYILDCLKCDQAGYNSPARPKQQYSVAEEFSHYLHIFFLVYFINLECVEES